MSNAVRGTAGTQGGGLAVGGGAAASQRAPADGGSFGGVLTAAMAPPAQPAAGAGDGQGTQGEGQSDGRPDNTAAAADPFLLLADLGPAAAGTASSISATASGGTDAASPAVSGGDTPSGKKRKSDASALDPAQAAQVVAVYAAVVPSAAVAAVPPDTVVAVAAGAASAVSDVLHGSPGGRSAGNPPLARERLAALTTDTGAPQNPGLVGPEDGTGPREPDGSDTATAAVGRPAAFVSAAMTASLPAAAPVAPAAQAATDSGAAPASGALDQPAAMATPADSVRTTTEAVPTVWAALAAGERTPRRDQPADANAAPPPAAVATLASAPVSTSASVMAQPGPGNAPAPAGAGVNVVTPDGSSQPLGGALGPQILAMVTTGRNQITVHLSPPDLGTLTVRVEVQSRDVSAWFASPQPQVQQAVSEALTQLHGSLSGAGLNLSGAWVGADVLGGNGGWRPAAPPPLRRAAAALAGDAPPPSGITPIEGLSVYA